MHIVAIMKYLFVADNNECADGSVTVGGEAPWGTGAIPDDITNIGWCEQQCNNIPGGYECGCNDGYILHDNTLTCDGKYIRF